MSPIERTSRDSDCPTLSPPAYGAFTCLQAFDINETIALEIGDALISTGLAKLGYVYVNIDAG
jgi:hypothetical protein